MKHNRRQNNTTFTQSQLFDVQFAIRRLLRTPYLRTIVIGLVIGVAALFLAVRVASAGLPDRPISAIKSPIPTPVTVVLDCDDFWNPSCRTSASTTRGRLVFTAFYIDGRFRGPANQTYTNVCQTFRLSDGLHTARVYARDSQRNSANVGPYRVIHCDRHGPVLSSGLRYIRGIASINPIASDRFSGVATMVLRVDGNNLAWGPYPDICGTVGASRGYHRLELSATDNVGNSSSLSRLFFCQGPDFAKSKTK